MSACVYTYSVYIYTYNIYIHIYIYTHVYGYMDLADNVHHGSYGLFGLSARFQGS